MNEFSWTSFTRRVAVRSSLAEIYQAWATASGIESWFLSKAVYLNSDQHMLAKDQQFKKGTHYAWNWFLYDMTEEGEITEANGTDHIQFSFAGSCVVDIRLSIQDEHVLVELTQDRIPTDEKSKQDIRLGCDNGWSFYLVNLKSVFENGTDLRNKNPLFKGMVNS